MGDRSGDIEEAAQDALEMSIEYPYDSDDRGNTALDDDDWTVIAARGILNELSETCKDIEVALDSVEDLTTRAVIVETCAEIIRKVAFDANPEHCENEEPQPDIRFSSPENES